MDFLSDGWPVHHRHTVIEEDKLVHFGFAQCYLLESVFDKLDGGGPTQGCIARPAHVFKQRSHHHDVCHVVVDHQDLLRRNSVELILDDFRVEWVTESTV